MRLLLTGLGVAIGWMLVSFVLGLSSSSALADESEDSGGLLGAVGAVAEGGADAVGAVTQPVADTAGDVVGGGATAVEKVAEPVTDTADAVVTGGAETIEKVAEPVTSTAEPVTDTAEKVAQPATDTASTVVPSGTETVAKVAEPVATVVATGADTAADTVEKAAEPVTDTAGIVVGGAVDAVEEVAAPATEPVLDIVDEPVRNIVGEGASVVDDSVDTLTATVGTVVDEVTDTAGDLLDTAPLQPIVRPVAQVASTALDTVGDLTESVGEERPVSEVVDVVTDIVEHTPVVGEVAEELGIPDSVQQVGGSLDSGVGSVGETIGGSGENLAPAPLVPALPIVRPPLANDRPALPATETAGTVDGVVPVGAQEMDAAEAASFAASGALQLVQRLTGVSPSTEADIPSVVATAGPSDPAELAAVAIERGGPFDSPGGVLPGDATAAGSGGTSLGAWGLIAFGPLFAYRAWMRRAGPADDRLPGAPIFETDASPD
ncbi:hypothetical protein QSU92_09480 [Microbacterium sp. ET2]|uniref:hypothetical protein n=1 Tax=Microbacterium albipurpureum TaxID=3050384 RepID=UPI00259C8455|nr:hypothetical protein [Microbacterium sp. ET2 (Ac-2212)]WJL94229.1 hypothetical protein QSU92_09480 [Microbacterium sp. ET2 (Ac-2212)]